MRLRTEDKLSVGGGPPWSLPIHCVFLTLARASIRNRRGSSSSCQRAVWGEMLGPGSRGLIQAGDQSARVLERSPRLARRLALGRLPTAINPLSKRNRPRSLRVSKTVVRRLGVPRVRIPPPPLKGLRARKQAACGRVELAARLISTCGGDRRSGRPSPSSPELPIAWQSQTLRHDFHSVANRARRVGDAITPSTRGNRHPPLDPLREPPRWRLRLQAWLPSPGLLSSRSEDDPQDVQVADRCAGMAG